MAEEASPGQERGEFRGFAVFVRGGKADEPEHPHACETREAVDRFIRREPARSETVRSDQEPVVRDDAESLRRVHDAFEFVTARDEKHRGGEERRVEGF